MLQMAAYVMLGICRIGWSLAFVKPRRSAAGKKKVESAPSSRWGIILVMLAYACEWAFVFPRGFHKSPASLIASMILGPPSVALAWMATRHLDKQWRFEAALRDDHELIKTGPYRWLRHSIYTSILGMLLQVGFAKAWWPLLVAGVVLYLIGTEVRIRAEEGLLASRFGEEFIQYRRTAHAYVPFIR